MRHLMGLIAVGLAGILAPTQGDAQTIYGGYTTPYRVVPADGATTFGTSYGMASFGVPRTYSSFSSPYGAGYGYGYAPTSFLPGPWGIGLWRPGFQAPGYIYGAPNSYRTFPYPYRPGPVRYGPPIGVYAPGFGPGLAPAMVGD